MSYRRIKDKFSGEKWEKFKFIAEGIYYLAETGVAIYNIVIVLNNKADCYEFQTFTTYIGDNCSQNVCTYWANQSMNYESLQSNGCYLSQQQGYVYIDSIYDSGYSKILIPFLSIIVLLLALEYFYINVNTKLRLYFLFLKLFLAYFNVMAMFLVTNINCGGICAVIANSDRLNEGLYYSGLPVASMCFFIFVILAKCCCDIETCLTFLWILEALIGIIGINLSNAYLLQYDYSVAGFEITFKIMIVFVTLRSFYSVYSIYITKKSGYLF